MDSEPLLIDIPGCIKACPACRHRHLTADRSAVRKWEGLREVLENLGEPLEELQEPEAHERLHYREQATLAAAWDQRWSIGMRKRDEVIPIPDCPVHSALVNKSIALVATKIPPLVNFPLAYVVQSGRQLTLVLKTSSLPDLGFMDLSFIRQLAELGLEGLWLHLHPSTGRRIFGKGGWHLLWGRERSRDKEGLLYGPTSFRQLIPGLAAQALQEAVAFLQPSAFTPVIDLYCGIGASLKHWLSHGSACVGVEWSAEALDCASHNAPAAYLLRGLCSQRLPQLNAWLENHEGNATRLLYVNPPRTGLEAEVRVWITRVMKPTRMAYLSCSAGTLKRDLQWLMDEGYKVEKIIPYDFFPQTQHVECLSLLSLP